MESVLTQLTESTNRQAWEFVQPGKWLWCFVYDNLNFSFQKISQQLPKTTDQINATTSAIITLPTYFPTTTFQDAVACWSGRMGLRASERCLSTSLFQPQNRRDSFMKPFAILFSCSFLITCMVLAGDHIGSGLSKYKLLPRKPLSGKWMMLEWRPNSIHFMYWTRRKHLSRGPSRFFSIWFMVSWDSQQVWHLWHSASLLETGWQSRTSVSWSISRWPNPRLRAEWIRSNEFVITFHSSHLNK